MDDVLLVIHSVSDTGKPVANIKVAFKPRTGSAATAQTNAAGLAAVFLDENEKYEVTSKRPNNTDFAHSLADLQVHEVNRLILVENQPPITHGDPSPEDGRVHLRVHTGTKQGKPASKITVKFEESANASNTVVRTTNPGGEARISLKPVKYKVSSADGEGNTFGKPTPDVDVNNARRIVIVEGRCAEVHSVR